MNGSGKDGSGRGNSRRRNFRRHNKNNNSASAGSGAVNQNPKNQNQNQNQNQTKNRNENSKSSYVERPKWVAPKVNIKPLPTQNCCWCSKPIVDISQAISDKDSGLPLHFDCVTAKISDNEKLDKGDSVTYIGGGRFGIVSFNNTNPGKPNSSNGFKIKKIIEWENKDSRAAWREEISEQYSGT